MSASKHDGGTRAVGIILILSAIFWLSLAYSVFGQIQRPPFLGPQSVQSVILEWDQIPDDNISGYTAFYGTASRGYTGRTEIIGNIKFAAIDIDTGRRWYFAVVSRNSAGQESALSDELAYIIPTPTPAPSPTAAPSPSPLPTPTPTSSPTPTATATPVRTPTPTPTRPPHPTNLRITSPTPTPFRRPFGF